MPRPDRREYRSHSVPSLSDATISGTRAAIDYHEIGVFQASALLSERLERNTRIMSALSTRTRGVLGLPFDVQPAETNRRRAQAIAQRFEDTWPRMMPQGVLEELLRQRCTMGLSFAQVVWTSTGGQWLPRLQPWHLTFVRWDDNEQAFDVQTRDAGRVWVRRGDPRWFVLGPDRAWMRGVVRCLALESTIREFAVRDWARWSEVHGLPIRVARVPASATEVDKSRFLDNIAALGTETTVLAPGGRSKDEAGFDLELREASGKGWEGFDRLIDVIATDVAIAITGHNLTTEVKGGSFAAAQVGDRVRYDYLEADVDDVVQSAREQFIGDWTQYNFGSRDLAPWPHWDASPPEDIQKRSATHKTAGEALSSLRSGGVPVDVRAFAESYGVPMLDGVEVAVPASAPDTKPTP